MKRLKWLPDLKTPKQTGFKAFTKYFFCGLLFIPVYLFLLSFGIILAFGALVVDD